MNRLTAPNRIGEKESHVDYSPLDNYRFPKAISLALKQTARSQRFNILIGLITLLELPAIIQAFWNRTNRLESILNLCLYFLLLFSIWLVYYTYRLRKDQLQAFAAANDWKQRPYKPTDPLPSSLSKSEYVNDVSGVIEMTLDGIDWGLFCMNWPAKKLHKFTVFRSRLTKDVPGMILDSRRTKGLLTIPKQWLRIELEGTFYKDFILYARQKTQVGVLSYMAPDLMALLASNHKLNDIQVEDGFLYVITDGDARDKNNLARVLPALASIHRKIN